MRVYLGQLGSNCTEAGGLQLEIVLGLPDSTTSSIVAQQPAALSCNHAECNGQRCAGWQIFDLQSPVTVTAGVQMAFALRDVPTYRWIGVSPTLSGHGGPSSLVVSPLFATKYAHYTFQTFMGSAQPGSSGAARIDNADETSESKTPTTTVVALSVLCALAVLVVVGFVYVRRSYRNQLNIGPSLDPEQHQVAEPQPGGHKRPITVRSAVYTDENGEESSPEVEDSNGAWAMRSPGVTALLRPKSETSTPELPALQSTFGPRSPEQLDGRRRLPRPPRTASVAPLVPGLAPEHVELGDLNHVYSSSTLSRVPTSPTKLDHAQSLSSLPGTIVDPDDEDVVHADHDSRSRIHDFIFQESKC